jgi:glycosyltransferase involved in cell wall biosynthesis
MKILVLTHEVPPIGGGGGRVALDLALGLAKRGHEVRMITAHIDNLPLVQNENGVIIERIRTGRKEKFRASFADMMRYVIGAIMRGRAIIREWKPDLIHAHFAVPAGASALILHALSRVPYVLTAHLGDVPGAVPEKTDRWFRMIYPFTPAIWKNASRVIAVSEFTRSLALKHYPVSISVIHNGVDRSSLPKRIEHDDPVIVFAGRFVETKNPDHLARALIPLRDLRWRCVMIGDGSMLDQVKATVSAEGVSDRFDFPGWIDPDRVLDHFAQGDILVLPSRSEGLPVVGVQGLALGMALAFSKVGGNIELVRENGFLFEPDDLDALTAGLRNLISNPSVLKRAKDQSLEMAKLFDLDRIVAEYEAIFTEQLRSTNLH